jgi:hypothetical protein
MTELLERAIAKVKMLSEYEQDTFATLILEEIEDEARWQKAFANSQDALARLAAAAMVEDQAGKTQPLDIDAL